MKKITLSLIALLVSIISWSQCGPGGSQFPGTTIAVDSNGAVTTISTCNYTTEFSAVDGIVAGNDYEVTIQLAGADLYVTVENSADDSIIAHGDSPFTFTAPAGVTGLHLNWSEDASCTYVGSGCRVTTIQDLTAAANACPGVENLTASNLTVDGADLSWDEPGVAAVSYDVEVYLSGESAGNGDTPVFTDAAVTGTMVTAAGLSDATDYDAYVTTSCSGSTATSPVVGPESFTTVANCADVADIALSAIGINDAVITWTPGNGNDSALVEVYLSGESAGNGNTAVYSNASATGGMDTATGLSGQTAYDAYVTGQCGATATTLQGPVPFNTACAAITAPYSEDFENAGAIPSCWSSSSSTSRVWAFATSPTFGNSYSDNTSGSGYFAFVDASTTTTTTDATLMSPFIDVSGLSVPSLQFFVHHYFSSGTDSNTITAEVWDGAAWNEVYVDNSGDIDGWEQIIIDLSSLTITGNVQARFIIDTETNSNFYNDIAIDDVSFDEAPSCFVPSGVMSSNLSDTSVDFNWSAGSTETIWEYANLESPSTEPTSGTSTMNTSVSFSSLTPETDYDFYVRSDCGGTFSSWVLISYSTPATPPANDDCTNSQLLTQETGIADAASATAITGTLEAATDSGLPAELCNGFTGTANDDVWYSFEALTSDVTITTDDGAQFVDLVVVLYSGSCGALVVEGCDDSGNPEEINATGLTVGDTYYFRVFQYGTGSTSGDNITVKVWSSSSLSTNEFENESAFTYFPNPVKNTLTLNAQNTIEQVTMFNMLGQEVLRTTPNTMDSNLDMSGLQTGAYFVKVTVGNTTETIRIIKE